MYEEEGTLLGHFGLCFIFLLNFFFFIINKFFFCFSHFFLLCNLNNWFLRGGWGR